MDLEILEKALQLRWKFPYKWGRKQWDDWDKKTNFIYDTRTFWELKRIIEKFETPLQEYAMNRWYNFWSAMWVEYIFSTHKSVLPNKNSYDKLVDFTIDGTSFDHKTSIYPNWFYKEYSYWKNNKKELIEWLYENQSQQWRKHLGNRLFIVLYDSQNQEHWKMKAEITILGEAIDDYMDSFNKDNLCTLDFWEWTVYSDIIWVEK